MSQTVDLGSVIGPQGPQGVQGIQGVQGDPGPNQVNNTTGTNLTGVLTGNGSTVSGVTGVVPAAESSPAAAAHAVNTFLVYNGALYRVTAAIAVGDMLTIGTNIVSADAASYLTMVAAANAVASGGVAPGGFGLGTATPTSLTTGAQVNALRESGWYAANISGAEAVNAGDCPLTYFGLLHLARAPKRMVQIGFSENTSWKAAVIMREMINDSEAWGPWEWINPPLVAGAEYRTTERFLGKPVYVKMFDVGAWGQTVGSYVTVNYPANTDRIVEAHIYDSEGRLHDYDSYSISTVFAKSYGVIRTVNVDSYITGTTCSVLLKYIKV